MLNRNRIALLSAAAALAVSLPTLPNGFAIDDLYVFVDQPAAHSLRNIPEFFTRGWGTGTLNPQVRALNSRYYRPIPTTLGAIEVAVFGLRPWGFHLTSALLHAVTAALVALLLWQLTSGAAAATLLGGLLFAIHPVQTEAFCGACYQTTLLAGCFGALALVLFGRLLERGTRPVGLAGLALSSLVAFLCKEEALVIPLFVVAWAVLLRPPAWPRRLWAAVIAMGVPWLAVMLIRRAFLEPSPLTYFADQPPSVVVLTMVRVAALYAELLVTPVSLCPFYDWFIIGHETGPSVRVLRGAVVMALAAAFAWWFRRRSPRLTLGMAWLALGLLPASQIVPIIVVAAERFLYLPMIGWSLLVGLGLARAIEWTRTAGRSRLAFAGVVGIFLLYSVRTVVRVTDWRNDETLNLATAEAFPETPGPYLNLATYYERFEGNPQKALSALAEAEKRAPGGTVAQIRAERIKAAMAARPTSP